jgi:regulatory protein
MTEDKPYERVMKRAFNLLAAKPRSIAELRERLLEKAWAEVAVVERAITRLQELGYLNDQQYAEQFANSRLTVKPIGKTRLRRDLQRKKLAPTVINQALEDIYITHDEDALIDQAVAKRMRLRGKPTTREESKKLLDYLLRQGFSYDLAMRKVRAAGKVDDDSEA